MKSDLFQLHLGIVQMLINSPSSVTVAYVNQTAILQALFETFHLLFALIWLASIMQKT